MKRLLSGFLAVLVLAMVVLFAGQAQAASFVKFYDAVEQMFSAKHDFTASGHVIKVYLSNAAPDQAADTIKTDLAEITMTNESNHGAGGCDIQNTLSETTGTATVAGTDCVFLASGTLGPFRYVVLYNDTQTSPADALLGYWDYGAAGVTLNAAETFTVDFSTSILTLQ